MVLIEPLLGPYSSYDRGSIAPSMSWRYDEVMSPVMETRSNNAPMPLRFSRAQFERMGRAGVFEGRRVELLDGQVIAMTPQGSLHAATVARIVRTLTTAYGNGASIR